jgi:hypothetical protein
MSRIGGLGLAFGGKEACTVANPGCVAHEKDVVAASPFMVSLFGACARAEPTPGIGQDIPTPAAEGQRILVGMVLAANSSDPGGRR